MSNEQGLKINQKEETRQPVMTQSATVYDDGELVYSLNFEKEMEPADAVQILTGFITGISISAKKIADENGIDFKSILAESMKGSEPK